jgi:hypothetical protein
MTDDSRDEVLIGVLKSRGYRVEKEAEPSLAEKVDDVAAKLDAMRERRTRRRRSRNSHGRRVILSSGLPKVSIMGSTGHAARGTA